MSVPRPFDYPTTGGATAHALFYPAAQPGLRGAGGREAAAARAHPRRPDRARDAAPRTPACSSGPRAASPWSTSTTAAEGYGREYRERLHGTWGVVDTDDAVNAARALAEAGEVDGARMAITGGSAGGWTVLCALAFHDVFAAGADHFGVADLSGFMDDTHKFESRYNDWLVGPLPEARSAVARALAGQPRGRDPRAGDRLAGPGGPGRPALAVGADRGGAGTQRRPARLPDLRGRAARLPPGGDGAPGDGRASCRSTRRCWASSRPTRSSRSSSCARARPARRPRPAGPCRRSPPSRRSPCRPSMIGSAPICGV